MVRRHVTHTPSIRPGCRSPRGGPGRLRQHLHPNAGGSRRDLGRIVVFAIVVVGTVVGTVTVVVDHERSAHLVDDLDGSD